MKKLKSAPIAFLFLLLTAFKTSDLPASFTSLLDRAQLAFTLPALYIQAPVIQNQQMNYNLALKHSDKNFEIRYAVRPLDTLLAQYERREKNKSAGDVNISPNNLYRAAFMATMLNISGGRMPGMNEFGKDDVKKEFNADWGATSICEPAGDFGKGYKYCIGVAIHKNNLADYYCFYLTDNQANFSTLMQPVFYALKFRQP